MVFEDSTFHGASVFFRKIVRLCHNQRLIWNWQALWRQLLRNDDYYWSAAQLRYLTLLAMVLGLAIMCTNAWTNVKHCLPKHQPQRFLSRTGVLDKGSIVQLWTLLAGGIPRTNVYCVDISQAFAAIQEVILINTRHTRHVDVLWRCLFILYTGATETERFHREKRNESFVLHCMDCSFS